jgi:predicted RNA-binding protein with PIN domain
MTGRSSGGELTESHDAAAGPGGSDGDAATPDVANSNAANPDAVGPDGPAGRNPDADAPHPDDLLSWADLPEAVRAAAIDVAARVIAAVDPRQIPTALKQVARFTPAKRAKRGAIWIGKALDEDAGFRAMVASHLPRAFGADPADPVRACARAFIARLPHSADVLAAAQRADLVAALRAQVAELSATVEALTARLADTLASAPPSAPHRGTAAVVPDPQQSPAEVEKLRSRLRQQGTQLREARDSAERSAAEAAAARTEARAEVERERAHTASWRQKAEQEAHRAELAQQALERQQDQATQTQLDADRRMGLLLDTVIDAAAGLKREWRLATGGADPADVVVRDFAIPGPVQRRPVDAALLMQWLNLPGAHMIIDGYNVTKTGYGALSLAQQRDRLTRSLTAVAARTGAEITVVFDGAAVVVPTASPRGVRVVFSPPGVIADDVIRQMAAAEPAGRVLIVVSSDREVADGVRRSGARVAASMVLLEMLGNVS